MNHQYCLNTTLRRLLRLTSLLALTVAMAACDKTESPRTSDGADLEFLNGRIYTVDSERTWAQSVAITDGRISYVGSDDRANEYVGANTTVIDLNGRMMLPAFQDVHIHPISSGMDAAACNLNELPGLARNIDPPLSPTLPQIRTCPGFSAAAGPWRYSVLVPCPAVASSMSWYQTDRCILPPPTDIPVGPTVRRCG